MNTEQKAKEIIEKFIPNVYCYKGSGMLTNTYDIEVATSFATACAIIHCEEFVKVFSGWPEPRDRTIQMELDKYKKILSILKSKTR